MSIDSKILYVDDQSDNLELFTFSFENKYSVYTALSAKEGLEILKKNQDIKLIISDQRMPIMSGTQFLKIVAKKYPLIIRIILTAYTDIEVIKEAINVGQVYRFLNKPWNKDDLKVTIDNALETYDLRIENTGLISDLKIANDELTSINQNLEELVNTRTNELQQSNEELEATNEELYSTNEELDNANDKLSTANEELNSAIDELNTINEQLLKEISHRQNAEAALKKYQNHLEVLVEERTLELKQSEEQLRTVSDNIPDGAIFRGKVSKSKFILEYASANFYRIFGIKFEMQKPLDLIERIHPEYTPLFNNAMKESKKTLSVLDIEVKYNKTKTRIAWLHIKMMPQANKSGGIIFDGLITDISKRKEAEQLVRKNEARFRKIFNSTTNGITIVDFNQRIIELNNALLLNLGFSKKELLNSNVLDLLNPLHKEIVGNRIKQLVSGKKLPAVEVEAVKKNGEFLPVEISSTIIDYDGNPTILSIINNISERKQMDRKLLETIIKTEEKEREKFARNLHDDIGPLLSSVKMYANSLFDTNDPKKHKYIVQQINEIVKEAIQSTKEISNDLSPHILVNYGLESALNSFINQLTNSTTIRFSSNIGKKRLDENVETNFYRIIKELITNTIKHAKAKQISIKLTQKPGSLSLIYEDNGTGINKEKTGDKGMGFFNIQNRIKSLNGESRIYNNKQGGFAFELFVRIKE